MTGLRRRRAAGLLVVGLLLTGCATDVEGELRRSVADLTDDANAGNADAVRRGADELIAQADDAVRSNDIDPQQGARIIALATLLRDRAGALETAPPSPTPTPTPSATPTQEPTQAPEPTEEPDDEPTDEPEPTSEPTPAPTTAAPSPTAEPTTSDPTVPPVLPGG
jgi:outer membrane biosynthesis protein TonB